MFLFNVQSERRPQTNALQALGAPAGAECSRRWWVCVNVRGANGTGARERKYFENDFKHLFQRLDSNDWMNMIVLKKKHPTQQLARKYCSLFQWHWGHTFCIVRIYVYNISVFHFYLIWIYIIINYIKVSFLQPWLIRDYLPSSPSWEAHGSAHVYHHTD